MNVEAPENVNMPLLVIAAPVPESRSCNNRCRVKHRDSKANGSWAGGQVSPTYHDMSGDHALSFVVLVG